MRALGMKRCRRLRIEKRPNRDNIVLFPSCFSYFWKRNRDYRPLGVSRWMHHNNRIFVASFAKVTNGIETCHNLNAMSSRFKYLFKLVFAIFIASSAVGLSLAEQFCYDPT